MFYGAEHIYPDINDPNSVSTVYVRVLHRKFLDFLPFHALLHVFVYVKHQGRRLQFPFKVFCRALRAIVVLPLPLSLWVSKPQYWCKIIKHKQICMYILMFYIVIM